MTHTVGLSFMDACAYQADTMIYTTDNFRSSDYMTVGTPLNLVLWIIASICIPVFIPF